MRLVSDIDNAEYKNGDEHYQPFAAFARTIAPLAVDETQISGDWLVVGPGPQFPERLLLCTLESNFSRLRKELNSLTCCERQYRSNGGFKINVDISEFDPDMLRYEPGSITVISRSLQRSQSLLKDNSFEGVLFFRIIDMEEQFPEILPIIARILKKDKEFIGSGRFEAGNRTDPVSGIAGLYGFSTENVTRLANCDKDCNYGYDIYRHFGFRLRKKL